MSIWSLFANCYRRRLRTGRRRRTIVLCSRAGMTARVDRSDWCVRNRTWCCCWLSRRQDQTPTPTAERSADGGGSGDKKKIWIIGEKGKKITGPIYYSYNSRNTAAPRTEGTRGRTRRRKRRRWRRKKRNI